MRKITYTMLCRPCWDNIAQENLILNIVQIHLGVHYARKLLYSVDQDHIFIFSQENNYIQCCFDLSEPTLHKKITCTMLAPYSTNNFAHNKFTMLFGSVWANITQRNNLWNVGLWLTDNFYEENKLYNVVSTMLGHIAQEYCLVIVVQIRLREHCTRKLLV